MPITTIIAPKEHAITVIRERSFYRLIAVIDRQGAAVNLAGYTGKAQIREQPGDALLAEFSVAINAVAGTVAVSLDTADTGALVKGRAKWDLALDNGASDTWTIVEGDVTILDPITEI